VNAAIELRWIKDRGADAAQPLAVQRRGGMATEGGAAGTGRARPGVDTVLGAIPWFVLAAALLVGGLLFAARAGDAYTHASGLLFAGFGLLLAARLLHRLLP
jgi:hypothetical protein